MNGEVMNLKTVDRMTVAGCWVLIVVGLGAVVVSLVVGTQQLALTSREGTGMELAAVIAVMTVMLGAGAAALWFAVWAFRDRARDRRREAAEVEQHKPFLD